MVTFLRSHVVLKSFSFGERKVGGLTFCKICSTRRIIIPFSWN